jgi:hypothetical protein
MENNREQMKQIMDCFDGFISTLENENEVYNVKLFQDRVFKTMSGAIDMVPGKVLDTDTDMGLNGSMSSYFKDNLPNLFE